MKTVKFFLGLLFIQVSTGFLLGEAPRLPPLPLTVEVGVEGATTPAREVKVAVGGRYAFTNDQGKVVFEGLPVGEYEISIRDPRYKLYFEAITLGTGERGTHQLTVTPTQTVAVEAKMVSAVGGFPVVGATVTLEPVDVAAARQGPYWGRTDEDGIFQFMNVPTGLYTITLEAAGYENLEEDWQITEEPGERTFSLAPETREAAVRVRVLAEENDEPLPGVRVAIAEAWPRGVSAMGETNVEGIFQVEGLRAGPANGETMAEAFPENWDDSGLRRFSTVEISSPQVMVYAEKDGYQAAVQSFYLEAENQLTLRLPSLALPERVPTINNHALGAARQISPGATVPVDLRQETEAWYRFRLEVPTFMGIRLTERAPVRNTLRLIGPDGGEVGSSWNYANNINRLAPQWLSPGDYFLQVEGTGTAAEIFAVELSGPPVIRAAGEHHTQATARTISPGSQYRGYFVDTPREDYYRFRLDRPSRVFFTLWASDTRREIEILQPNGEVLANAWRYSQQTINLTQDLGSGDYFLRVSGGGNSGTREPYSLGFQRIADDGINESMDPFGRIRTPRTLEVGDKVGGLLFPDGDRDFYRLSVPSGGRLLLRSRAPYTHDLRLFSSEGELLEEHWRYRNQWTNLSHDFRRATTVFVEVAPRQGRIVPQGYVLESQFQPEGELNQLVGHQSRRRALPIQLGQVVWETLFPAGDEDWYSVQVDHPGTFTATARVPVTADLTLTDHRGEVLESRWRHRNQTIEVSRDLLPGTYYLQVAPRGSGDSLQPYRLGTTLQRAEPAETVPLDQDAVRRLTLNRARTWQADQAGDVDRFVFEATEAGEYHLFVTGPVTWEVSVRDSRTGKVLHERWRYANQSERQVLDLDGPTRLALELRGRGTQASLAPGYVLISERRVSSSEHPSAPPQIDIKQEVDPGDPTLVTFYTVRPRPHGYRIWGSFLNAEIDPGDGSGTSLTVGRNERVTHRYPSEGRYVARIRQRGDGGVDMETEAWVEAIGAPEMSGLSVFVDYPSEGEVVFAPEDVRVRALSFSGHDLHRVEGRLNGQPLPTAYSRPFTFPVAWTDLPEGTDHLLEVTAIDRAGERAAVERTFRVSGYLDLQPEDGAVLTGNQVTVSWRSGAFSETRVRYRPVGSSTWQEARGESGRWHVVRLADLEPEVRYEFQPLGGAEEGPVRTVTRVRGLAFGQTVYGPTIERDYDQRVPITIRNHSDEEMTVQLEAGHPGNEELLVGFVEEGAAERPFPLGPGEERSFILSLNAQDAMQEDYVFPVRIQSDTGFADEAEVQVTVRLPEVAFDFASQGLLEEGLGERIRITNEGDSLTDFSLTYEGERISLSPMITHGYFPAGQSMEFTLRPALYDGFREARGVLQASAVRTVVEHPYHLEVPEGQTLYRVTLSPEANTDRLAPGDQTLLESRALAASLLHPGYIRPENWQRSPIREVAGGFAEWVFIDEVERLFWVARDTNGDGEIDFVKADVGFDGQFDYAALRMGEDWRRTNILGVTLETSFTHPRDRQSYDPYDVELSLNDQSIGGLEQTLPEGNYRFQVPPTALNFDEQGWPGDDRLSMRSRGMGRGSYGMQSDLQVQVRLAPTPMWSVASSREEAEENIRATEGLVLHQPDFSISSADKILRTSASPQAGEMAELTIPVANIGAGIGEMVEVALSRSEHRGQNLEIQRLVIEEIRPNGAEDISFSWPLSAGRHRYRVQVDPDGHSGDPFSSNNNAYFWIEASGDLAEGSEPQITILTPADGVEVDDPTISLQVEARGDMGLSRVEVRVDSGLWQPLVWQGEDLFETTLLLSSGEQELTIRATDGTGQRASENISVTVTGTIPEVEITHPEGGSSIEARQILVRGTFDQDIFMAGARVNGGPWQPMSIGEGMVFAPVGLRLGENHIEVKVVTPAGRERVASVRVRGLQDAREDEEDGTADEEAPVAEEEDAIPSPEEMDIPGFGPRRLADDGPRARRPGEGEQIQPPGVRPHWINEQILAEQREAEEFDTFPEIEIPEEILAEWADWEDLPEEEWNPAEEVEAYDGTGYVWDPENLEDASEEEFTAMMENFLRDYLNDVGLQMDPDYWLEVFGEDPEAQDSVDYHGLPLPSSGLSGRPPAGRSVSIQQTQKTRHCTNRPVIGMRFEMPEWLQMLDLPEPGTEEFQAAIDRLLTQMRMEGYQMNAFEDLHRILRNRAMRMESPEELPSFLQSVMPYFTAPPERDPEGLQEWREGMAKKVDAFWLRLLSSGDPSLIYQGLRARADSFQQFDEGAMLAAQAAMDEVQRHQNNMETVISAVPIMGDVFDLIAIYQGETLAGEEMTAGRVAMMAGMRLAFIGGPKAGRALYNRMMKTQNGRMVFSAMREMGGNFSGGAANRLARWTGSTPEGVRDFFTRQRSLQGGIDWMLGRKTQAAGRNFVPFRAGQEAMYRQRLDQRHAENFLNRMSQTTDPAEFRRMAVQLQRNKTAQAMINTPNYSNELRRRADLVRRKMGASADRYTIAQVQAMDPESSGLNRVLQRHRNVRPEDVRVRSRTITGHRPRDGQISYGRDRDVWFEFVDERTGQRLGDVHHDVSGRLYNDHLQSISGYNAADLDHTVTSWWHPDTYGTGVLDPAGHERSARRIVDGASAGHLRRAQDVADTARYKPREWFNAPHDSAGRPMRLSPVEQQQRMREGFRQSLKEYNRHVRPYLDANGLSPNDLPPRLREGLRIFQDTQPLTGPRSLSPADVNQFAIFRDTGGTAMEALENAIPPEQATRMLESIGSSPEGIVDDLADYIQFINLFGHGN
ncbi:MAG: hypothetical protein LAT55_10105 [Opitutales bacterium]|nr:hypothetical protein [Opitutales bacterium]